MKSVCWVSGGTQVAKLHILNFFLLELYGNDMGSIVRWGTTGMPFKVKNSVTWDVVMIEQPFVCNIWPQAKDPFSEPIKDVFIKKRGHKCWIC